MGERLKRDVLLHETGCRVLVSWIIEIAKRERKREMCNFTLRSKSSDHDSDGALASERCIWV